MTYQLAVLVGPSEEFRGVTADTWMSDQVHMRLGSPSKDSIYDPPYLAGKRDEAGHGKFHGGANE